MDGRGQEEVEERVDDVDEKDMNRKNNEKNMEKIDVHAEIVGRHARMQSCSLKARVVSNKRFPENSVFTQRVC